MALGEYQARFLPLEKFVRDSFSRKRERSEKFVAELRLSIQFMVWSFACATLTGAA